MTERNPDTPRDRPVNPGDVAGGAYGRDKAEIAKRSEAHTEKDGARGLEPDDRPERELDDEPEGRASKT